MRQPQIAPRHRPPLDPLLALSILALFSGLLVVLLFVGPLAAAAGGTVPAALVFVALPASVVLARCCQLGPARPQRPLPRRPAARIGRRRRGSRGRRLPALLAAALSVPLPR